MIINGKRINLNRCDDWSPIYKGSEVVGEPLIIFENLGMTVTVDENDNVFVQNKSSGVVVKLAESGGAIIAEKLQGTVLNVRFGL